MARPQKVSDEQLQNAILQAHAEGKSLSIREIQARVGGGDMKRISQALDRFKKDNGLVPTALVGVQDEILDDQEMKRIVDNYKALKQAARQSLVPERQQMQAELEEAVQVRDDALNENERLVRLLEITEDQKANFYEQLRDALKDLKTAGEDLEKAREKILALEKERLDALAAKVSAETQRDDYLNQLNTLREEIRLVRAQAEEGHGLFRSSGERPGQQEVLLFDPTKISNNIDGLA